MAKRLIPTLVTSSLLATAVVLASVSPALAEPAPSDGKQLGITSTETILGKITAQAVSPDGSYYFATGSDPGKTDNVLAVQTLASGTIKTFQLGDLAPISLAVGGSGTNVGATPAPTLFVGGTDTAGEGIVKSYTISALLGFPQSTDISGPTYAATTTNLHENGVPAGSTNDNGVLYHPDVILPSPHAYDPMPGGTSVGLRDAFYVLDSKTGAVLGYRRSITPTSPRNFTRKWFSSTGLVSGDMEFSSDGGTLYVGGSDNTGTQGEVAQLPIVAPSETNQSTPPVFANPAPVHTGDLGFPVRKLVLSKDGDHLYVLGSGPLATGGAPTWVAASLTTGDFLTATPETAPQPGALTDGAVTSDGSQIYTAVLDKSGASSVIAIDPATLAGTAPTPAVALNPDTISLITSDGASFIAASASTGAVDTVGLGLPMTGPAAVNLTGAPAVGSTISIDANATAWAPGTASLSCQWYLNGTIQIVSTGCSYTPTADQLSDTLYAVVTAKQTGYLSQSLKTNTVTIVRGTMTASGAPKITGTAKFGSTLKITLPTFGPAIAGFAPSYSYQWYANGASLTAVASRKSSYTPANVSLLGKTLSVVVTAHAAGFNDLAVTSAATKPVASGPLTAKTPTLIGSAKVGTTLTANHGSWGPGTVHFVYRWYANGKIIPGKTTSKLKVSKIWIGKQIRVKVYGTKTGFVKTVKTSAYKKPHK